ncbi:MAG: hypothetical protein ACKOEP_00830, partial [Phycisphaerales bacterium]
MTAPTPERRMPNATAIHMADDEPRGKDAGRREGGPRAPQGGTPRRGGALTWVMLVALLGLVYVVLT